MFIPIPSLHTNTHAPAQPQHTRDSHPSFDILFYYILNLWFYLRYKVLPLAVSKIMKDGMISITHARGDFFNDNKRSHMEEWLAETLDDIIFRPSCTTAVL